MDESKVSATGRDGSATGARAGGSGSKQAPKPPAAFALIVNADDLGYDSRRDVGVLQCFQEGVVRSASLLVNGASASTAAAAAAKAGLPLGLHLNLTEGAPVAGADAVPSLVDAATGHMLGKMGFRNALGSGAIDSAHIRLEIQAQLAAFVEITASPPSHVDGHQHVHVLPQVCQVLAQCMQRAGVTCTRIPEEPCGSFEWLPRARRDFYDTINDDCDAARKAFQAAGVAAPDAFVGYGVMGGDMTVERVVQRVAQCIASGAQSCEVMVHPGLVSDAAGAGCGGGVDDFALSADREHELELLMCRELKNALDKLMQGHGLRLCGYREWCRLREELAGTRSVEAAAASASTGAAATAVAAGTTAESDVEPSAAAGV